MFVATIFNRFACMLQEFALFHPTIGAYSIAFIRAGQAKTNKLVHAVMNMKRSPG